MLLCLYSARKIKLTTYPVYSFKLSSDYREFLSIKQGFLMNLQISRDVNEIILRTMLWSGFERLINPMIPSLIDR